MNVLLIRKGHSKASSIKLGQRTLMLLTVLCFFVIPLASLYTGYRFAGEVSVVGSSDEIDNHIEQIAQLELEAQKVNFALEELKAKGEGEIAVLARRLGQVQAHVIRLDALGQRLIRVGGLEDEEFDFANPPAQGGPDSGTVLDVVEGTHFIDQIKNFELHLTDRLEKLRVIESLLINSNYENDAYPAGRPIKKGWLSSPFGLRRDPLSGKKAYHKGIDFAAKAGSDVIAVAGGVVTIAKAKKGYGHLVEINHGTGYATRYGHNRKLLVKLGDAVKRGQVIAEVGSTGRSTGPHVHFEVRRNGKAINPRRFLRARAKKTTRDS